MTSTTKPRYRIAADGSVRPLSLPAPRPAPGAAFMRGEAMPLFFRWHPALREANDDVKSAWRLATARTIDAVQNNGWLAGLLGHSMAAVVGPTGLRLNAKPNAAALGWTQPDANAWARKVETRFSLWAESPRACDAGGRFDLAQLQSIAYRHWLMTGETLATLPFFKRPGSAFGTKIRVLPAWRLSDRSDATVNLVQGVRLDGHGAPRAYRIKRKTPWGGEEEIEIGATDAAGRPLVVHLFDGEPDQARGISPLTPILKVTRQFDQLADATLTAALIQAVFAAMFKSGASTNEVMEALSGETTMGDASLNTLLAAKAKWYEDTDVNLGVHGKILHGFPGDEMQFFRSEHPNDTYEPFAKFLLREVSRAGGVTFEDLTGDYAGATFSSVKMSIAAIWPQVVYRRKIVPARLCQAAYEAWLEEDIEAGGTPFPGGVAGFLANRDAACQSTWRGPTRPEADELKAAKAAETWQKVGVPDRVIFDAQGLDVDDVYEERQREKARRAELGIEIAASAPDPVGDSLLIEGEKAK